MTTRAIEDPTALILVSVAHFQGLGDSSTHKDPRRKMPVTPSLRLFDNRNFQI